MATDLVMSTVEGLAQEAVAGKQLLAA